MVLNNAQTIAFFDNANQMAIPRSTVVDLQAEVINTVRYLIDFNKTVLTQVSLNLRRPGRGVVPLVFGENCSSVCRQLPI